MVIVGINYIDRCKSNYHRITSSGAQHYNVSNADGYIILFVMSDLISFDLVSYCIVILSTRACVYEPYLWFYVLFIILGTRACVYRPYLWFYVLFIIIGTRACVYGPKFRYNHGWDTVRFCWKVSIVILVLNINQSITRYAL